jgi:hypothetical protein
MPKPWTGSKVKAPILVCMLVGGWGVHIIASVLLHGVGRPTVVALQPEPRPIPSIGGRRLKSLYSADYGDTALNDEQAIGSDHQPQDQALCVGNG